MGSIPDFLASTHAMYGVSGMTDTAFMLTDLATILPAAGWSTIAADRYRSPATSGGRYIECAFSSISAAQFQMILYDCRQVAVATRRMNITTGAPGSAVRYFYGNRHIFIDCQTSVEFLGAFVLEASPLQDTDILWSSVVIQGTRDSGGSTGGGDYRYYGAIDPASGSYSFSMAPVTPNTLGGTNALLRSVKNDYVFFPMNLVLTGGFIGRPYQSLMGDAGTLTRWTNVNVPLGDGTTGVFMRVSPTTALGAALFQRVS